MRAHQNVIKPPNLLWQKLRVLRNSNINNRCKVNNECLDEDLVVKFVSNLVNSKWFQWTFFFYIFNLQVTT